MKNLKIAVRELRKEFGETQQEFATRLGLAISTVVRYELSREPSGEILLTLGRLAEEKNRRDLRDMFSRAYLHEKTEEPGTDKALLYLSLVLADLLEIPDFRQALLENIKALFAAGLFTYTGIGGLLEKDAEWIRLNAADGVPRTKLVELYQSTLGTSPVASIFAEALVSSVLDQEKILKSPRSAQGRQR
ncbi:MAG: helix-turn-helix transcriptional regulator [Bryobacteraceae bacterium]